MRILASLAAAAAIAAGSAGVAGATPTFHRESVTGGTAGWTATKTLGALPSKAADLGAVAASTPLTLTIALKGNYAGAAAMVKHVYSKGDPNYHKFLTPKQFTAMFAASPAAASAVASYLSSFGMTHVSVLSTRTIVTATTNAGTASRAFNTSLHAFNLSGHSLFTNVTAAEIPASLSGAVQAIGGLNNFSVGTFYQVAKLPKAYTPAIPVKPHTLQTAGSPPAECNNIGYLGLLITEYGSPLFAYPSPTGDCYPAQYTPNGFRLAYDDEGSPNASNTVIADITESCLGGQPYGKTYGDGCLDDVTADLWESEYYDGIPQTPTSVREVDPGATLTGGNAGEGEWDIDTQGAAGIAGGAKGEVYYNMSTDTLNDLTNAFAVYAADDSVPALNASIGACEIEWYEAGLLAPTDFVLAQSMLQGQTVTVASGDTGSFCPAEGVGENGVPAGLPDLDYPATSPYVLAVGGTSLMANDTNGTYGTEITWYSSDGGMSYQEPQSPWQQTMIYDDLGQFSAVGNRVVPDVVMDADLNTGIIAYVSGAVEVIGGTSLAAPLAEGVWARLESVHNNGLGAAAPSLYTTYQQYGGGVLNQGVEATLTDLDNCVPEVGLGGTCTNPPPAPTLPSGPTSVTPALIGGFRDITIGANGFYTAAPGFDLTTGMGSLDINALYVEYGS